MRESPLERFPTGIDGLDTVLAGGFIKGSVYVIQGDPGAGKTVLANQIAFNHARAGGKTLFVTLLAELHGQLLCYLEGFDFFDPALVPSGVYYVSAFGTLEQDSLKGFFELLRREVRTHAASLLVIDGLTAVREAAPSAREVRRFVHELQAQSSLSNCTTVALSSGFIDSPAEQTVVDGILDLHDCPEGARDVRTLHVRKLRGVAYLRGRHQFRITERGLVVYPRIEALLALPRAADVMCSPERIPTGAAELDRLLGGGYPCGSTTVLLGSPGTGKSTLALQFLAGVSREQPGVVFGFYERPELIVHKAAALGFDLQRRLEEGSMRILWQPPTDVLLDEVGHRILSAVHEVGARRLVIDGLDAFRLTGAEDRTSTFFSALTNELRALGVTTLYTAELPGILEPEVLAPLPGVSALFENLLVLRQVQHEWRLRRVLTVAKVRDSEYADGTREFCITPGQGLVFSDGPFDPDRPMTSRRKAAKRSSATGSRLVRALRSKGRRNSS